MDVDVFAVLYTIHSITLGFSHAPFGELMFVFTHDWWICYNLEIPMKTNHDFLICPTSFDTAHLPKFIFWAGLSIEPVDAVQYWSWKSFGQAKGSGLGEDVSPLFKEGVFENGVYPANDIFWWGTWSNTIGFGGTWEKPFRGVPQMRLPQ